jgi:sulfur-oxidizing protein SoxA
VIVAGTRLRVRCLLALACGLATLGGARADDAAAPRSGYQFSSPMVREMQDDAFANPGMLWVAKGRALWDTPAQAGGKSCAACHGAAETGLAGVAARYPRMSPQLGKPINLEQRINLCRAERMQAPAYAYESDELLALTTLVRHQSRGQPVTVEVDSAAAPFLALGKAFFEARRGAMNLACSQCHERIVGKSLRDDVVSQGQSNGFPAYRLRWQTLGSLHLRFQACNFAIGAEPLPLGDDDYVNLELYVAWRGRGLPIETPAVRR